LLRTLGCSEMQGYLFQRGEAGPPDQGPVRIHREDAVAVAAA